MKQYLKISNRFCFFIKIQTDCKIIRVLVMKSFGFPGKINNY
jgi:hypothetical protein